MSDSECHVSFTGFDLRSSLGGKLHSRDPEVREEQPLPSTTQLLGIAGEAEDSPGGFCPAEDCLSQYLLEALAEFRKTACFAFPSTLVYIYIFFLIIYFFVFTR